MNRASSGVVSPHKYERVVEFILRNIRMGIYPDGSCLPSESALALELGVSRATVREAMAQMCRRNIIAKHQGHRSVVNAGALRGGRARTLRFGWITRDPMARIAPVYLSIYSALQKAIQGINGNLLYMPLMNPQEEEWGCSMLDTLDGVFLAGVRKSTLIAPLAARLMAMPNAIEIDDVGDTPAAYTICTDNYQAGWMAAEYLANAGRHTAVFVSDRSAFYRGFHDRIRGVLDGFSACKVKPYLCDCEDNLIGTAEFIPTLERLLREFPQVDALWHATDNGAMRIRRQLEALTNVPPGHFYSAGVDGISGELSGEHFHLSVGHPVAEIARLSFRTMMGLVGGESPEEWESCVPPQIVQEPSQGL